MINKVGAASSIDKVIKEQEKREKQKRVELERRQREKIKLAKQKEKERIIQEKVRNLELATQKTNEAAREREKILGLLQKEPVSSYSLNWNKYKVTGEFKEAKPMEPRVISMPEKPLKDNYKSGNKFLQLISIVVPIIKKLQEERIRKKYEKDINAWEIQCKQIKEENTRCLRAYEEILFDWEDRKKAYEQHCKRQNEQIEYFRVQYKLGCAPGIEFYFKKLLDRRIYPKYYPRDFQIQFIEKTQVLIINHQLPKKEALPNLKEVKYVVTKKTFSNIVIKSAEIDEMYDQTLYQLALHVNSEVYHMDIDNKIDGIIFNGWLTDINKSNGKEESHCILSLHTQKEEFQEINLSQVDPKLCFRRLKGIAGIKLSDLAPVTPIADINREDKRFIEAKTIGSKIEGFNIAMMHWQDFEHLIRELFEKKYSKEGMKVEITQSSKDGGVDAVMYNSDPIIGGKYIIQAKKYTNVVGVSAVRELYGAVMNEQALKGILVTTSYYGNAAYEFAKANRIKLLDGGNLLQMLLEYGYNVRIDIEEARQVSESIKV